MLSDQIELVQAGAVVTVTIRAAELTHLEMQELIVECEERVRCHNGSCFVFDMTEVQFLASACLGAMVSFLQDLEHVRGRVALVNCQENVAFVFKVTRLDIVFPMFEDVKEAIASF